MRGLEGQLYNKANELQEDISMKKFDLRAKEIHLAAVQAQVSEKKITINFSWHLVYMYVRLFV